jgi:hypothetical protein
MSDTKSERVWQVSQERRQSAQHGYSYRGWWPSEQVTGRIEKPERKVEKDRSTIERKR